jgi:hypothetical protein
MGASVSHDGWGGGLNDCRWTMKKSLRRVFNVFMLNRSHDAFCLPVVQAYRSEYH